MRTKKIQKIALDLNPAEQVLMHRFRDACALEDSMNDIRQKYAEAWEVLLKRTYPELEVRVPRANDKQGGRVGCGRKSWPSQYPPWPSGFYIERISFDSLCAYDKERPFAGIWIVPPKKLRINLEAQRKRIREKAELSLGRPLDEEKLSAFEIEMWYNLPETSQELISALTTNGGRGFFDIMESHLNFFRPLIPVIDAVFRKVGKQ